MSRAVYLYTEHKNFRSNRNRLNSVVVYESNLLIIIGLSIGFAVYIGLTVFTLADFLKPYHNASEILAKLLVISPFGIAIMLVLWFLGARELHGLALWRRFQAEGVILNATVTQVTDRRKVIEGKMRKIGGPRSFGPMVKTPSTTVHVRDADYVFQTPTGERFRGNISSESDKWPRDIHEGDSLTILYLDSNNYCVL